MRDKTLAILLKLYSSRRRSLLICIKPQERRRRKTRKQETLQPSNDEKESIFGDRFNIIYCHQSLSGDALHFLAELNSTWCHFWKDDSNRSFLIKLKNMFRWHSLAALIGILRFSAEFFSFLANWIELMLICIWLLLRATMKGKHKKRPERYKNIMNELIRSHNVDLTTRKHV